MSSTPHPLPATAASAKLFPSIYIFKPFRSPVSSLGRSSGWWVARWRPWLWWAMNLFEKKFRKRRRTSSQDISTYHWKIIKWVYVTHQASAAGQAKVKGGIGTGRLNDEGSELSQTVTLPSTPKLNLDWFRRIFPVQLYNSVLSRDCSSALAV